jgi:elongation factor Ts
MEVKKEDIVLLREKTKAGVMDIRRALTESDGDLAKAEELLRTMGEEKAEAKSVRATGSGLVETYVHGDGKIGVMVEVACETDFVAKTDEFKSLAHELALQIAAMDPTSVDELLEQEYIKDPARHIADIVHDTVAKTGENIKVKRFQRFVLGT